MFNTADFFLKYGLLRNIWERMSKKFGWAPNQVAAHINISTVVLTAYMPQVSFCTSYTLFTANVSTVQCFEDWKNEQSFLTRSLLGEEISFHTTD